MVRLERYFEDIYEYVDLWASGLIKAYIPEIEGEGYLRLKTRVVEAILDRLDTVNQLRLSIGLDEMETEDCYDYYINNVPELDEKSKSINLYKYDVETREMAEKQDEFQKNPNAQAYLVVMGAPDIILENSHVMQERIDLINRLLVEGGHAKISPQKTEEVLTKLLVVSSW